MIHVVSYPGAGRTWFGTLLAGASGQRANAFQEAGAELNGEPISFTHLFRREYPILEENEDFRKNLQAKAGPLVYLTRNPWDNLVAWYFHKRNVEFSEAELGRVLEEMLPTWVMHQQACLSRAGLWVFYRRLKANPREELARVFGYLGIEKYDVEAALREGSMERMREWHPQQGKIRRGVVGGFRDYLDEGQIARIRDALPPVLLSMHEEVLREEGHRPGLQGAHPPRPDAG